MKSKFIPITLKLLICLILLSCSDDEAGQIIDNTPTTFEIIANSPNHNTLEELLINFELRDVIDSGIYTVFAPTDEAFAAVDLSNLTDDQINQILLNHILTGKAESSDFGNGYERTNASETFTDNANPLNIYINVDSGLTLNGVSSVTKPDNVASNGVVHFVDAVITIPDVTTFVTADTRFSSLATALTRDDQPDFVGALSSFDNPAPFTVFAPTNDAFTDLLAELEIESLADINTTLLTSTLNTHVIASNIIREEDLTTATVGTLGDDIDINAETAVITDLNGRDINIIITNIQAGNGVIHVVDKVILPMLQ